MLTLPAYFAASRNRDLKHNAGQVAYRNRNTTWDRWHTGIETQHGTGFKRESRPETQRGTGFKQESRPNVGQGGSGAYGASYRNRDPKHNVGPTYTSCRRGFKWEP
ncbi:hypothetical protein TNCV_1410671 [Trichonephila clavipes]|nr:hypothetical protein TNCV_1410671 [Trichonephila clavipes]